MPHLRKTSKHLSLLSVAKLCPTLCNPMDGNTPGSCRSLSPGVCSKLCSLSQWCYLTISSFAILFSFCLQSFPASESFPMSHLFASGGQNTGASASTLVLLMSIQGWFPLGWLVWSPGCPRTLKSPLQHHSFESINSLVFSLPTWICQQSYVFAF